MARFLIVFRRRVSISVTSRSSEPVVEIYIQCMLLSIYAVRRLRLVIVRTKHGNEYTH